MKIKIKIQKDRKEQFIRLFMVNNFGSGRTGKVVYLRPEYQYHGTAQAYEKLFDAKHYH